jgi:iron complex outermembrane receptor protein
LSYKNASRRARRAILFGCSAIVTSALAPQALAQAAPEQGGATLTEIVVTAQKREQSLQDVPISITAVTQDLLRANRITNVNDLNAVAPNLTVRESAGGVGIPSFSMRGIVSYGVVPGSDKSISLYIDGVYIGSATGSAFELPDVERIEVLRGPQGTLFGRNATGGAVSVITRNPSGQLGVRQELTYGNYNNVRTRTRIDIPAWGPLSASVNYVHEQRDGDIKNAGAGQVWDRTGPRTFEGVQVSPKTLGAKNTDNWFAAVRFDPNDSFNTVYKFDYAVSHSSPAGVGLIGFDPRGVGGGVAGNFLTALLTTSPGVMFAGAERPKYVNNNWTTNNYERVWGHNVTSNLRINDNVSVKNILAYRQSFTYGNTQISGAGGAVMTPQALVPFSQLATLQLGLPLQFAPLIAQAIGPTYLGQPVVIADSESQSTAKQFSDEVQVNYDSKYLTLTTGALYFHLNTTAGAPYGLPNTPILTPFPGGKIPLGSPSISYNYATSTALYTQAEFHVLPQLDVVGGYRITRDLKKGTTYIPVSAAAPTGALSFDYAKTKPSYLFGLNYKPTRDILVYGKYSNAFVSGGAIGPVTFEPETASSWEFGAKADLLDRRLRTNIALFTVKYENLQSAQGGVNVGHPELGTAVLNLGSEKAKGFEAEITALPMTGLTLNAGVGYTDTDMTLSPGAIAVLGADYISGLRSKWTANMAAQYETQPVLGDATAVFRIDTNYLSEYATYPYPTPSVPAYKAIQTGPARWIVNGRVALQHIKLPHGDAELALWAKNITDNKDITFPLTFGNPPFIASTNYQAARTFGVDFIYNY